MIPANYTKQQLIDLKISLEKEFLLVNDFGSYSSSTIIGCHTRRYHGLLAAPQQQFNNKSYVLLSSLDETILRGDNRFSLATHQYPNTIHPEGYISLEEFTYNCIPQWIYKTDDLVLKKEILLMQSENRLLIRYTVLKSMTPFQLSAAPMLAFRSIHSLCKENMDVIRKQENIENGIKIKMYDGFNPLFLQWSLNADYIHVPDWFRNFEYKEEQERGYDFSEDLYCPGNFNILLKQGDQMIFSAGETEIAPEILNELFESELLKRRPSNSFDTCLENAARQFIIRTGKGKEITAGYHWFGRWGRDTFISLPGLTLALNNVPDFKVIIDSMIGELKDGLFPNAEPGSKDIYNTVDASLWFIWALQQYAIHSNAESSIWNEYGFQIKSVLENYRKGTFYNIKMNNNGLIECGENGIALTWMDAVVEGVPVTPRIGMPVEINALWYNAVCFAIEAARLAEDSKFIAEWEDLPEQISESFLFTFWDEEKGYLADYAREGFIDWSIRPNQIIAASLPYSPVNNKIKQAVLNVVESKLLTPRGLRTLSPDHAEYKGQYRGSQIERDHAYHQGTVWVWLLGHFSEAYLKLHGKAGVPYVKKMLKEFEPVMTEKCLYAIPEIFDAEAPHAARGAVAQAWSVAELLRMNWLIKKYSETNFTITGRQFSEFVNSKPIIITVH